MSAPAVHIPSPRRPVRSAGALPQALPSASPVPAPRSAPEPRHRAGGPARHGRPVSPVARTFTVLARAGSLTTLAAMVVLAAALAGLADGEPPAPGAAGTAEAAADPR